MTVEQLAEEIATEQGESYADQDVRLQMIGWVKEVVDDVIHYCEWTFRYATQALVSSPGVATYPLLPDTTAVRAVSDDASGLPVSFVDLSALVSRGISLTATGNPSIAAFAGEQDGVLLVRLWPVPVSARTYTFLTLKASPTLADTDTLPLPAPLLKAVRAGVRARYFENADDGNGQQREMKKYEQELMRQRESFVFSGALNRRMGVTDLPARSTGFDIARFPF